MSDVYTDGNALSNLLATGYDRFLEFQLRSEPIFRQFVDKHPVSVTNVGPSVVLSIFKEFADLATTPLSESSDVAAVAPPEPDRVTVNVNEYGNAQITTLRARQLAYTEIDPAIARQLGKNMVDSLDKLVRVVADSGTHVIGKNSGTLASEASGTAFSIDSVTSSDKMDSTIIRSAVTLLRRRNALARDMGDNFVAVAHPDVINDIVSDTGWLSPHQYRDTLGIYNAEVGSYLGARFISSPRCTQTTNGSSIDVYNTYFFGRQALVEATISDAHVVVGPQVDRLRRFSPLGWLYHGGWAIYRDDCLEIAQTSSSVAGI